MLPKRMSSKEWTAYLRRMREREQLWARTLAARFTPEERAAMIQEAQRNSRHGFAVSYPAVGIQYPKKSRSR